MLPAASILIDIQWSPIDIDTDTRSLSDQAEEASTATGNASQFFGTEPPSPETPVRAVGETTSNEPALVPYLRVRPPSMGSSLYPAIDLLLRYNATGRYHCVGFRHHSLLNGTQESAECTEVLRRDRNAAEATSNYNPKMCTRCSVLSARLAEALHHSHTRSSIYSAQLSNHLNQPNYLYLAAFGEGTIKVGTSTASRVNTRLTEQGALKATLIANVTDGIQVREAEDLITAELGIPQSVSVNRKLRALRQPTASEHINNQLSDVTQQCHKLLDERLPVPLIDQAWTNPGLSALSGVPMFEYPNDITSGNHRFRIKQLIGKVAIVQVADDRTSPLLAVALQTLLGTELAIGDVEPDPVSIQETLF